MSLSVRHAFLFSVVACILVVLGFRLLKDTAGSAPPAATRHPAGKPSDREPTLLGDGTLRPRRADVPPAAEASPPPQLGPIVRGEVVSATTGRPVEGARVQVVDADADPLISSGVRGSARSGEDGRFEVLVEMPESDDETGPQRLAISVGHSQYRPSYQSLAGPASSGGLTIALKDGAQILGKIVDADGTPVEKGTVYCQHVLVPFSNQSRQALPIPPYLDRQEVESDSAGAFRIAGIDPLGHYALYAFKDGLAQPWGEIRKTNWVAAGTSGVTLVLQPAFRLRLRIVDAESGAAPWGSELRLGAMRFVPVTPGVERAGGMRLFGLDTEDMERSDGIWLGPERDQVEVRVIVAIHGYRRVERVLSAPRWNGRDEVPVHLVRLDRAANYGEPGELVLSSEGESPHKLRELDGQRCYLEPLQAGLPRVSFTFKANEANTQVLRGVPPGAYFLRTDSRLYVLSSPQARIVVKSDQLTRVGLIIPPFGSARLIPPPDAVPSYAIVEILESPHGSQVLPRITFPAGERTLRLLAPGKYRIRVRAKGLDASATTFVVEPGRVVDLPLAPESGR